MLLDIIFSYNIMDSMSNNLSHLTITRILHVR